MDIDLIGEIDEMHDPDTVLGFLYKMCLEQPFDEEPIHPDVKKYIQDLEPYILDWKIEKYDGYINIDPLFFQENKKISMEFFPILAFNIKSNSDKDIKITSGDYVLNLYGYTPYERLIVSETGSFREIQPQSSILLQKISTHMSFPKYTNTYAAGAAFVKKTAS